MTKAQDVAKAKQLLRTAKTAQRNLELSITKLVSMRAWELLEYPTFVEMWVQENGCVPPTYIKVLAINAMRLEGMNTRNSSEKIRNGHTAIDIASAIGMPISIRKTQGSGRVKYSGSTQTVLKKLAKGTKPEEVTINSRPTRPYNLQDVFQGFYVSRDSSVLLTQLAKDRGVSKSVLCREAIERYLQRELTPTRRKRAS